MAAACYTCGMDKQQLLAWMEQMEHAFSVIAACLGRGSATAAATLALTNAQRMRDVFATDASCASIKDPTDTPPPSSWPNDDQRSPSEILRDLYTALILDVHTVQRRLARALRPGEDTGATLAKSPVGDALTSMESCIRRLEPLIDAVAAPPDTPPPSSWPSVARIRKETRAEVVAEIVAYLRSEADKRNTSITQKLTADLVHWYHRAATDIAARFTP